jgi:hypothetical protein
MKRFLVIANIFVFALAALLCTPAVLHGSRHTACTAFHVSCSSDNRVVVVHFGQKVAFNNGK